MINTSLIAILKSVRPEAEFAGVDDFFTRGLLDSFDLIMLISSIEERFGITIGAEEITPENFRNIESLTALLGRHGADV
jgi:acyl carrier protein